LLLQLGHKYGLVTSSNYQDLMALIEDTGGENRQELDRKISQAAQVCCSAAAAAAAAADTVFVMLLPATAFDVCTPFAKLSFCATSKVCLD